LKKRTVVGLAAASFALALGISSPAAAAAHAHEMHTGDAFGSVFGYSGSGVFTEEGDQVNICDIDADGYAVWIGVYEGSTDYSNMIYEFSVGGEGNCEVKKASNGGKYNLPEKKIAFKFCRYKDGQTSECADYSWVNDH
jgi:hypothetical protein